jgi:hypothetical protein
VIEAEKLVGTDPVAYWRRVNFLNLQQNSGNSQQELLNVMADVLRERLSLDIRACGSPDGPFLYLDDVLFSGNRIRADLLRWLGSSAPAKSELHVVTLALFAYGAYSVEKRVQQEAKRLGKEVGLQLWNFRSFEDRVIYFDSGDVLRPTMIPDDPTAQAYWAEISQGVQYPPRLRQAGRTGNSPVFSSEEGRHLLEQQFLLAGLRIRSFCENPSNIMRPLGYQFFPSLGFGAMVIPFRNCPNNCPLALWWGDPHAPQGHPFRRWYPLLPRQGYTGR